MYLKISFAKWRPFCPGVDDLNQTTDILSTLYMDTRYRRTTTPKDYSTDWVFDIIGLFIIHYQRMPLDFIGLYLNSDIFGLYVIYPGLRMDVSD